jgi:hypothetical protein
VVDLAGVSDELALELTATVEVCGAQWTKAAVSLALRDLAKYPEPAVIAALARCRGELKYKLTLGDIVERIDDGRPAPDEAWAHVSAGLDERATVVATDEALEALGEVRHLAGDHNAVRMAFREAYKRIVVRNKAAGALPSWVPSLGQDPEQRVRVLEEAADRMRLSPQKVAFLLGLPAPSYNVPRPQKALPARSTESYNEEGRERVAGILANLGQGLAADREKQRKREAAVKPPAWADQERQQQAEEREQAVLARRQRARSEAV